MHYFGGEVSMSMIVKKMLTIITIALVIMIVIIVSVNVVISKNHSDNIMYSQVNVSVGVLKNSIQTQIDRLKSIALAWGIDEIDYTAVTGKKLDKVDQRWEESKGSDYDYACITDLNGIISWKTENCEFDDPEFFAGLNENAVSGIFTNSNTGISVRYVGPVTFNTTGEIVGYFLVGMDLRETSALDGVKLQTGADVSLFSGNNRYATTITDESGNRATDTPMSDSISKAVITDGREYVGQANLFGQNYFVSYQPMTDYQGNVVGAYFAGVSSSESDSSFVNMAVVSGILAVVVLVLIDLVMMIFIRRFVGQPIVESNRIAEEMRTGQLSTPDSNFKFGNDEIGLFAKKLEEAKHNLRDYINDISRLISMMAKGDFSGNPNYEYIGDFVQIDDSFKLIRKNLSDIIQNINTSADSVRKGAEEMADGASRLANGTSTQTSAIETLAAAIEEISDQIHINTENTEKADELSKVTADRISNQDREISNMLDAMQEIKERSNQIGDIIKTIEDIAFQTNILSLNAAIEAARAGEAGKGFAVVADEVRNLATKSSEAAGSTTELITATITAVNHGAEIAERTAAAMAEVKSFSEQTGEYIAKISKASEIQLNSVKRIEEDTEQIRSVTERNSLTAEQSAASCEELSGMSNILQEEVSKLKA